MAVLTVMVPMFAFALVGNVSAQADLWGGEDIQESIQSETGLTEQDPRVIVARVIRVLLGFLGIIATVIILLGGFKWMTAAGNEDKVSEARKLMLAGVIGLIIIMASFAIANFVVTNLFDAMAE